MFRNLLHERANYHHPDYFVIGIVSVIVIFGLIMLSSASSAISYVRFNENMYHFFNRQIVGIILGFFLFYILSKFDYHRYKNISVPLLIFSIILLVLVFLPWFEPKGYRSAQSWIRIPIIHIELQPSEIVKLSFLLYLAAWLESRGSNLIKLEHGTIPFLSVLFIISLLMLLQPDTGTLFIILIISLSTYFIAGGNIRHILYIVIGGITGLFIMLKIYPYQLNRFRCFFDSSFSPNFYCYQINQSLIAIGSGGFLGRGFGNSRQKFLYLPEVHGDAIFPIIAEEMGFIGILALIALYIVLMASGLYIAISSQEKGAFLLASVLTFLITIQAFLNLGIVSGLLPSKGMTLPFFSQGGSSLMVNIIALFILLDISRKNLCLKY